MGGFVPLPPGQVTRAGVPGSSTPSPSGYAPNLPHSISVSGALTILRSFLAQFKTAQAPSFPFSLLIIIISEYQRITGLT